MKLVRECADWLEWYPGPIIVPMISWLPDPRRLLVMSLQCSQPISKICLSRASQHVFCVTSDTHVIQMFHIASKILIKTFTGIFQTLQYYRTGSGLHSLPTGKEKNCFHSICDPGMSRGQGLVFVLQCRSHQCHYGCINHALSTSSCVSLS